MTGDYLKALSFGAGPGSDTRPQRLRAICLQSGKLKAKTRGLNTREDK